MVLCVLAYLLVGLSFGVADRIQGTDDNLVMTGIVVLFWPVFAVFVIPALIVGGTGLLADFIAKKVERR